MAKITRVEVFQVNLQAKAQRGDAIQSFPYQETPMVRIRTDDGGEGTDEGSQRILRSLTVSDIMDNNKIEPSFLNQDRRQINLDCTNRSIGQPMRGYEII